MSVMNQSYPANNLLVSDQNKHQIDYMRPTGIFWDIENLQVPFNRSVSALVKRFRDYIINKGLREVEFDVVCDTSKVNHQILDDLNASQVTVIHVSAMAKNAADDKLKHQMKRFVDTFGYHSAILVITDDINFAPILSDYNNSFRIFEILVQRHASDHLKSAVNLVESFESFCENLPLKPGNLQKESSLVVSRLPSGPSVVDIKKELAKLTNNCGGKKIFVNKMRCEATIRFGCYDDARRAHQRINNHKVFGHPIICKLETVTLRLPANDSTDSSDDPPLNEDITTTHQRSSTFTICPQLDELMPICNTHSTQESNQISTMNRHLPNVNISLHVLSTRVHRLLDIHGGSVPLKSFLDCYVHEFHELFNTRDPPLVSLDHLITCVPGVSISMSPNTLVKRIIWLPNRDRYLVDDSLYSEPIGPRGSDHWYSTQLGHFGKEVRELLKSHSHATIAFNKFVPSYHAHFVRQLCVNHFGCQKLSELLEEIPHIVQVYGENDHRMITLTHREQTKRFATDLIKVLKAQDGRKIKLSHFPEAYKSIFERTFEIVDYGVCYFEDILRDIWEGTVIITPFGTGGDKWIELPKRERTNEQKRRTNVFTREVEEMLRNSKEVIDFQLTFSKFIPCYHRYFNRQCRVNDYGYTKLIELLEELSPNLIEIGCDDKFGEKQLRLNYDHRLNALAFRFESILRHLPSRTTTIANLEREYQRIFNHQIDYTEYCSIDLNDLLDKMGTNKLRIIQTKDDLKIVLVDGGYLCSAVKRVVRLLMEESSGELDITQLEIRYLQEFREPMNDQLLTNDFANVFTVDLKTKIVRLTEMFEFCRDCIVCMQSYRKQWFTVEELDRELQRRYDKPLLQPTFFKCRSICELFGKFFDFFRIEPKKKGVKPYCIISLDPQFQKKPLQVRPPIYQILRRPEPDVNDILNGDIPPIIKPPNIIPQAIAQREPDLIDLTEDTLIDLDDSDETPSRSRSPSSSSGGPEPPHRTRCVVLQGINWR